MIKVATFLLFFHFCSFVCNGQSDVLWKFKTNDRVYSSPIIEGDVIFVGSGDHNFYAIDKVTGKENWKFKTEGAIHSSAYITGNLVCFASADGNLYALNKDKGNLVWKFSSKGEKMYDLWDYYLSSPKGNKNTIYWGAADGNLYAIHCRSGLLKWSYKTEGIIHATPVIYKNNVFVGSFDGKFYCIDKESGKLVWKFQTLGEPDFPNGEIQRAALVKDDVVYFGSRDFNMYALDATTGIKKWHIKQPQGWIIATPIALNDNIYFGTSDGHKFYAVNKVDGITDWTIPLSMRVFGSAIVDKKTMYFGTFDGKIIGIDFETGKQKWEFQTETSKLNYSHFYNKEGHFKDGFELYGANYIETEKQIHTLLGSILSTPIIDNEIIYFGSSDGNLYAVKLD